MLKLLCSSAEKNIFDISEKIGQNRLTKAGGYGNIVNTSKRVYFFVPKNEGTVVSEGGK